jgi:hypothetical protein
MKFSLSNPRRETFFAVLLVIVTTLLTYGTLISKLGFYRDDWYLLWTAEALGREGLLDIFRGDRPFVGWLYVLDFSMLGIAPFGWHLYALLIKVASALVFLWLLRSLWPNNKLETTFITLLFVVYPGFYQQPNALTYKQLLIAYTAALLSLVLTIQAVKSGKAVNKVILIFTASLLSIFYFLIYESLVGIEAVRILLLWYIFYRDSKAWKQSVRSALANAVPYLLFAVLFVLWRIFIFQSTRNATNFSLLAGSYASMHGLIRLFVETGKDLFETSILAWGVPFYQFSARAIYRDVGLALGLGLLVVLAGAGYYFLVRNQVRVKNDATDDPSRDWLVLGAAIIFVTTLPIVVAGRDVIFGVQWDRYTYQSVFGVALFVGGFIFYALRGRLRWLLLVLLLLSGVSTQVFSGIYYRDFWKSQREAWWQLYWRAPQIENGATVLASLPGGFQFAEEYEIWGPLNLVYNRGEPLNLAGQVLSSRLMIDLEHGTLEERLVRNTITVNRDYNRVLVTSTPTTASCLHIYDGLLPHLSPAEMSSLALIAPYSDINLIQLHETPPIAPSQFFGVEPDHGWCYFYQKITLSLQAGQWAAAAQLADQAREQDLQPRDVSEWLPVLFAYANDGDEKRAKQTSTYINDKTTRLYFCQQFKKIDEWPAGYRSDIILRYLCRLESD